MYHSNPIRLHVAVNTRFLLKNKLEGIGIYSHEILRRMTHAQANDHFDFYFDRAYDQDFIYSSNITPRALFPPARHALLFYIWFQHSLRRALNRAGGDVFFSPDGFMPLGLKMPSVITIHDVAHRRYPRQVSRSARNYYERWLPKFVAAADSIITVSDFSKQEILEFYPQAAGKIKVIHNGVPPVRESITAQEKSALKRRFTAGRPFLIYIGAIHPRKNVETLIRAFDVFKSQSTSPHQLLIAGRKSWQYAEVEQAYQNARHKSDVVFTGYLERKDLMGLLQSADALVNLSLYEGFGLQIGEALACGTPVLCSDRGSFPEVAAGSALLVDPRDVEAVADGMNTITTDEALRDKHAQSGLNRAQELTWESTAERTYQTLKGLVK